MSLHWLHPIIQGKAAPLPIPGGAICTFCSSSSSSWGTRATKRGGTLRRGVYLHSIIISLSKHFLSRALNRVVLPAKERGDWSHWQLCSFVLFWNRTLDTTVSKPVISLKCLHYCGGKKQILEGRRHKMDLVSEFLLTSSETSDGRSEITPIWEIECAILSTKSIFVLWDITIEADHRPFVEVTH